MNIEEAKRVARIAKLALSDAELERLVKDADEILRWADALAKAKAAPAKRKTGELRDDIPREFDSDSITQNFPKRNGKTLEVPKSL